MSQIKKFKLSLRMRVTMISGLALVVICLLLSSTILLNAQNSIIGPTVNSIEDGKGDVYGNTSPITGNLIPLAPYEEERYQVDQVSIDNFYKNTMIGIVLALIGGIVLIYVVTGIALKPVKKLKDEIADTDAKDLTKRITGFEAGDELDSLARSFNEMLDRIQSSFERERSFSAGASHELKTPLAVIKTNLDVLALSEQPTVEEYSETMDIVKKQTQRMGKLVDDLFAMCALNGYAIDEKVFVNELVHEILYELEFQINERNIVVQCDMAPCMVKANAVMLRHAISNVLQNAIKYNTDSGTIIINIKESNGNCEIKVADTGIGISKEAAEHIFEPFYREDKSRSRKIGGAGLGLSIVKSIVEQHGGVVYYEMNMPSGSVFTIQLPVI